MKVLVLNGSPKKQSDTFRMTDGFSYGRYARGRLLRIGLPYLAAFAAFFAVYALTGRLEHPDPASAFFALPRMAAKAVLDRTIPLMKMDMVQLSDGRVQHVPLADFSKIHTLVLCGCGFPDWEGNFDALKMQCKQCFGNLTMVCVPETPMLNVPQAAVVADPLLDRFEAAGAEYAQSLCLSPETVARLETPMIPKEVYVSIVNGG